MPQTWGSCHNQQILAYYYTQAATPDTSQVDQNTFS